MFRDGREEGHHPDNERCVPAPLLSPSSPDQGYGGERRTLIFATGGTHTTAEVRLFLLELLA